MALNVVPILPDIGEELRNYIICPDNLPIHQYENNQEFWPRTSNVEDLLSYESFALSTTLEVIIL